MIFINEPNSVNVYQKIMGIRREARVSEMKLICIRRRNKEPSSHVHREEICAVAASDRDGLEQAGARNTHLLIP